MLKIEELTFEIEISDEILSRNYENGIHRLSGPFSSSLAFICASAYAKNPRNYVIICSGPSEASAMAEDISLLAGPENTAFFPELDCSPYETKPPHMEIIEKRLDALDKIVHGKKPLIFITTAGAAFRKSQPLSLFDSAGFSVKKGDTVDLPAIAEKLTELGFERCPMVQGQGQYSIRGGIIDIFPPACENPFRIELWGDEAESLREFDVFSQRSISEKDEIRTGPPSVYPLDHEIIEYGLGNIEDELEPSEDEMRELSGSFITNLEYHRCEWLIDYFFDNPETPLDWLKDDVLFILDNTDNLTEEYTAVLEKFRKSFATTPGPASEPEQLLFRPEELLKKAPRLLHFGRGFETPEQSLTVIPEDRSTGRMTDIKSTLNKLDTEGYNTYVLCDNKGQAQRLSEMLEEEGILITPVIGSLREGFIVPGARIAVLTDDALFNRYGGKIKFKKQKTGAGIKDISLLSRGDFVVHIEHGIGRFIGIEHIRSGHSEKDCIRIEYAGKDRLTLPIEDIGRLQKYSYTEEAAPPLSKLGSTAWRTRVRNVRKSLDGIVKEIVDLYARRRSAKGFSFSHDSRIQKEFEDSFLYEDTPDQATVSAAVKKDMEKSIPMDRVVCGDVGLGKTEIAMRASLKAALDNKQTAVLVPTTILAQQHFLAFSERFRDFPVKIDMISRFVSRKDTEEAFKKTKSGHTDILIGTHKLLSSKLDFKDLGLLIIDEEHKFGVKHKEKLKSLKENIDSLSLTATPIPRTLQMAVSGIRDLSIIATAPRNRLPIQTVLIRNDGEVIKKAIEREIRRGGQVFIIHNRVKTIQGFADRIKELCPDCRITSAHGQMYEKDLERTMLSFINHEFDILVSTMIIESGIDIPNVNTLIIDRAEYFGLAQLHQIRGRIGRASRQAYAYLITPPPASLPEPSRRKLKTLEQYTELGAGFQIAMRDLEIRGAGNMLGIKQSGLINSVGVDLYNKMLKESVEAASGGVPEKEPSDIELEIEVSAYIPDNYITDEYQRLEIYSRITKSEALNDVEAVFDEITDRFGKPPAPAVRLLDKSVLRILCAASGVQSLISTRKKADIIFRENILPSALQLAELQKRYSGSLSHENGPPFCVKLKDYLPKGVHQTTELRKILNILSK